MLSSRNISIVCINYLAHFSVFSHFIITFHSYIITPWITNLLFFTFITLISLQYHILHQSKLPHSFNNLIIPDFALLPSFRHECILLYNITLIFIQNTLLFLLNVAILIPVKKCINLILVQPPCDFIHCIVINCLNYANVSTDSVALQVGIVVYKRTQLILFEYYFVYKCVQLIILENCFIIINLTLCLSYLNVDILLFYVDLFFRYFNAGHKTSVRALGTLKTFVSMQAHVHKDDKLEVVLRNNVNESTIWQNLTGINDCNLFFAAWFHRNYKFVNLYLILIFITLMKLLLKFEHLYRKIAPSNMDYLESPTLDISQRIKTKQMIIFYNLSEQTLNVLQTGSLGDEKLTAHVLHITCPNTFHLLQFYQI